MGIYAMIRIEDEMNKNMPAGAISYYDGEDENGLRYNISYTEQIRTISAQNAAIEQLKALGEKLGAQVTVDYMVHFVIPCDFAAELKEGRKHANLSQNMLSIFTAIPKRTIENWESGTRIPPYYVRKFVLEWLYDHAKK